MLNSIWEMLIRRSRVDQSESGSESYSESSSSSSGGGIPTDYVLYMPFTEDLLDHSTYARSFITSGTAPTLKTDEGIPCAEFPLSTNMRTTDNTGITLGTGDRTMSLWFRSLSSTPSNQYNFILALGSGTNRSQTSIGADRDTGTMQYGGGLWGGSASTIVKNTPVDTLWHHMLWMIKNNHTSLYFDGVLARYSDDTLTLASDACITLRNTCNSFSYPFGAVCQYSAVRIYDRAVTDDEIFALANEDFSQDQSDSSSSGSDSSSSGGGSLIPTDYVFYAPLADYAASTDETGKALSYPSSGVSNNVIDDIPCVTFSSGTSGIKTTDTTNCPTAKSPWTQSIWVYLTGWRNAGVFSFGTTSQYKSIHIQSRTTGQMNGGGWYLDYTFNYTFQTNTWYNIVQTYDGTTFRGYVNGVLTNEQANSNVNVSYGGICIGAQVNGNEQFYNGSVASARLYNRVLTDDEIQALANEFGEDSSSSGGSADPSTLTVSVTSDYPPGYMAAGTYNLASGTGTSAVYTQSGGTYELSYNTTDARWEITDTPPDPSFPRAVYFYNATLTGNYTPYIDYYGTCTVN